MSVGPSPPTTAPHNPRRSPEAGSPTGHTVRPWGDFLQHTTCACGRPSGDDAYTCTHCANTARTALRTIVDGLDADLTVTLAKQGSRPTTHGGGHGKKSEAPLPIHIPASEARDILHSALRAWVKDIHSNTPHIHGPTCRTCTHRRCREIHRQGLPRDTMPAMAAWLLPLVGWTRNQEFGPKAIDELSAAVDNALRVIDVQEERVGVGRCPKCASPVYAPASRITAYCKTEDCDGTVDVGQWQQSLQDLAWSHEAGATELAAFARKHLGLTVTAGTIRSWASRNQLDSTNPGEGTPRYRFADVFELIKNGPQKVAC